MWVATAVGIGILVYNEHTAESDLVMAGLCGAAIGGSALRPSVGAAKSDVHSDAMEHDRTMTEPTWTAEVRTWGPEGRNAE
jgi:hypothetical protein